MTETICPYCKTEVSQVAIHCESCGFPLTGTEKEKAIFIGQQTMRKSKVAGSEKMIYRAQIILYVIAGLQALNGLLAYFSFNSIVDLILHFIIGSMLAAFSYLSPKKPILFVSLALCVILFYYLLLYLANPMFLFQGIIWKVAIIMALLYTLYNAVEVHNLKKKHNL
jgi:hypothetical protein